MKELTLCKALSCKSKVIAMGMCRKHYDKERKRKPGQRRKNYAFNDRYLERKNEKQNQIKKLTQLKSINIIKPIKKLEFKYEKFIIRFK